MWRHPSLHPLSHQHHNGLALGVMVERSLSADPSPENLAKQCRRAADRFEIELRNHFELEEQVLFPACRTAGCDVALVDRLEEEHRQLEALAGELALANDRETLAAFLDLLKRHIRTEENVLFGEAQSKIDADTLAALGRILNGRAVRVCL